MRALTSLVALAAAASSLTLAGCSPAKPAAAPKAAATASGVPQAPADAPAGTYFMDLAHTSVSLRLSHMGLSHYTARFTKADGVLVFDPANPTGQSVTATIDARSLQTDYPDMAKLDFDAQLEKEFLDAEHFPQITFKSTRVEPTGPKTARLTGELTLHGVTKPVTLEATFNGGYKPNSFDPMGARVGFSARGTFKRSDFGITYGLPAPGTTMGVGDEVEVIIETEFTSKKAP
jgi:polyisoprenoid-binding protein YceI